jgi:hypothetical protein
MTENTHNNAPPPPVAGRWKPGQSGNPSGRPKRKPITEGLQRLFAKLSDEDVEEYNQALFKKAAQGDVAAYKEVSDRVEGKIPQAIGGTDELPAIKGFAWIDPK